MQVTIKEKKNKNGSFKERVAQTRAMYDKMLNRDVANFASEVLANIRLNGFDETYRRTYHKARPYRPFRGADRPNKKGEMLFKQKQIVSRTGMAKNVFNPVSFTESTGTIHASNGASEFSMSVSGKRAIIEISGFTALKIRRRIGIIRRGLKTTRKDWSDFKKAVKSNMREHVSLLNKMQQARKAKKVNQ